jgi:hypothetical protein
MVCSLPKGRPAPEVHLAPSGGRSRRSRSAAGATTTCPFRPGACPSWPSSWWLRPHSLYPPNMRIATVLDNFSSHLSTEKDDRVGRKGRANNVDHRSHEEQNSMTQPSSFGGQENSQATIVGSYHKRSPSTGRHGHAALTVGSRPWEGGACQPGLVTSFHARRTRDDKLPEWGWSRDEYSRP